MAPENEEGNFNLYLMNITLPGHTSLVTAVLNSVGLGHRPTRAHSQLAFPTTVSQPLLATYTGEVPSVFTE